MNRKMMWQHFWFKTSLMTEIGDYDNYECEKCGITGKRYGTSWPPRRDKKYQAKIYERCDTAQEHLQKKEDREEEQED